MPFSFEDIILSYSNCGMDILREHLPSAYCGIAAKNLLVLPKGNIFIATGFYVAGYAETDGPLGALFLCKALKLLGHCPIIVTDEFCRGFFEDEEIVVAYVPFERYSALQAIYDLLGEYSPVCCISIEGCGKNNNGIYASMSGTDISEYTAPIDVLFEMALSRGIHTIGIGDGGNEIGMGNAATIIEQKMVIVPCVVSVNYLIIATVSNWGAYGLIAYLQSYSHVGFLPMFDEIAEYLQKNVTIGSVDGVTKGRSCSVDGFSIEAEKNILDMLHESIRKRM